MRESPFHKGMEPDDQAEALVLAHRLNETSRQHMMSLLAARMLEAGGEKPDDFARCMRTVLRATASYALATATAVAVNSDRAAEEVLEEMSALMREGLAWLKETKTDGV